MSDILNPKEFTRTIKSLVMCNDEEYASFDAREAGILSFYEKIIKSETVGLSKPLLLSLSSKANMSDLVASTACFGEIIRRFNFILNSSYGGSRDSVVKNVDIKTCITHFTNKQSFTLSRFSRTDTNTDQDECSISITPETFSIVATAPTNSSARRLLSLLEKVVATSPLWGTGERSEALSNYGLAAIMSETLPPPQRQTSISIHRTFKKGSGYGNIICINTNSPVSVVISVGCSSYVCGSIVPPCPKYISNLFTGPLASDGPPRADNRRFKEIHDTLVDRHNLSPLGHVPINNPFDIYGDYSAAFNYHASLGAINYILAAIEHLNCQIKETILSVI